MSTQTAQQRTDSALSDKVKDFLLVSTDAQGSFKYVEQIDRMMPNNAKWITVDYNDLVTLEIDTQFQQNADQVLKAFSSAILKILRDRHPGYAEDIKDEIRARIINFPAQRSLRKINAEIINRMTSVAGMVIRASEIKPLARELNYVCPEGHITKVELKRGMGVTVPVRCSDQKCTHRDLEVDPETSKFIDFQIIRLQELPEDLPPGQNPHYVDVTIKQDLVNNARPGDRIILTGIVRIEQEQVPGISRASSALYRLRIDGNNIEFLGGRGPKTARKSEREEVTPEDEKRILDLAKDPDIYDRLVESFAPHIQGHQTIKEAILLLITGATQRMLGDGSKIRGDINIFLVGDPGTAKSEMLKFCARIAPRGLYTSGRGSTGAGLTAAVVRDKSGIMMLEAGATVLGDQGLVCIDEFDKMKPEDRSALHEVMEQQCYDDKTSILTESGWKLFGDLLPTDKVATKENDKLVYRKPTSYFQNHYKGAMVKVKSGQVNLLVTPNHKMYVNINKRAGEYSGFGLVRADKLPAKKIMFDKTAKWDGVKQNTHVLPPMKQKFANDDPPRAIKMNDWAEFIGYYVSGGSCRNQNGIPCAVHLSSSNPDSKVIKKIGSCITRMGFEPRIRGHTITVHSKQLAAEAASLGTASDMHLPAYVKQLPPRQLRILYEAMLDGDGYRSKTASGYVTSSIQLRDDFQEICLKLGLAANDCLAARKGDTSKLPGGRTVATATDMHDLNVVQHCTPEINHSRKYTHITYEEYDGMVYCVEVPSHIIYVSRDGIPVWCGNSVSIAKGGIVATLNARTSILAAANPMYGKYDVYKNITENANLPIPLLTRFDLIFVIRDTPSRERDTGIAKHIIRLHTPRGIEKRTLLDVDMLTKYLGYAKRFDPSLTKEAEEKILEYYLKLRNIDSGVMITATPRQLEGLIRLTMARARLRMSSQATVDDAERAISLLKRMLDDAGVDPDTSEVDMGVFHGKSKGEISKMQYFMDILRTMEEENNEPVEEKKLVQELVSSGKFEEETVYTYIRKMLTAASIYEPKPHYYSRVSK